MRGPIAAIVLFAAASGMFSGCGESNRPATAPVRGQLTFQGKPVGGATINFLCRGAPRLATGTTDEAGNYRLSTFEPNDGAIVGTHMVTVRKDVPGLDALPPGVSAETEISAKATEEAVQRSMLLMERAKKVKPPIPLKYADMQTSDLRKEVVEGENVINIELTH
jgi:hypothetical protein